MNPKCPSGVVLVLLDKDMPVSGFEFLDRLADLRSSPDPVEQAMTTIRVVGCTAHGISTTIQGFRDRGAVDVLLKPAGSADFVRVLEPAAAAAGLRFGPRE